jgi:hypothetical protein
MLRDAIIVLSYEKAISNSVFSEDAQSRLHQPSHFSGATQQLVIFSAPRSSEDFPGLNR